MNKYSSSQRSNIAGVVLAAGASTRMGQIKQLLPWNKSTLLEHAINQLIEAGLSDIFCVVGSNSQQIQDSIKDDRVVFLDNPEWGRGMGTSLRTAIDSIQKVGNYDAVLIALTDQPLMLSQDYYTLINTFHNSGKKIVSSLISELSGVPAIIDKKYFHQLVELNKDQGARKILRENKVDMIVLDFKEKTVDIDTIEEYNKLKEKYSP